MRASTYVRPAALESRLVHFASEEIALEKLGEGEKKKRNLDKIADNDSFHAIFFTLSNLEKLEHRSAVPFHPSIRCESVL